MWISFKEIFKDKKYLIILILILIFWVILLSVVFTTSNRSFNLADSDGYIILLQSEAYFEGHPQRLHPGDASSVGTSDYLYPLLMSIGHWIGFRDKESFILWTYIYNLLLFFGSSLCLYRFFMRFFPEVTFPAIILSVLFAPIFYNFFICTNFSIYFFFFTLALAFLECLPFFLLFSILTSLSRPEGFIPYIFLVTLYFLINKNIKKNWWKFALGFIPIFIPLFLNLKFTGQFAHQGAVSQSLFNYDSISNGIKYGALNFLDHFKGTLLGLYHTREWFGLTQRGNTLYTLPPLLFIFTLIGFLDRERRVFIIPVSIFLFIVLLGDSLTFFTGLQFNRRILHIFPFLFAFSFMGIKKIDEKINGLYLAFLIFFSIFFVNQEFLIFSHIKDNISYSQKTKEIAFWIKKNLPKGTLIFHGSSGDNSLSYWDDHSRRIFLTPNHNPFFVKYIKSFWETTSATELIQRYHTDVEYLFIGEEKGPLTNWIKGFSTGEPVVFSWIGEVEKYYLYHLDMTPLKRKRFVEKIVDEVDIGDPVSENNHGYRRVELTALRMNSIPFIIDGIHDNGRIIEGVESFEVKSPNESGIMVCLLGSFFEGRKIDFKRSPVSFKIKDANYQIFVGGEEIAKGEIRDDFQLLNIIIPPEYLKNNINIAIKGNFVSYHYWVKKGDI